MIAEFNSHWSERILTSNVDPYEHLLLPHPFNGGSPAMALTAAEVWSH